MEEDEIGWDWSRRIAGPAGERLLAANLIKPLDLERAMAIVAEEVGVRLFAGDGPAAEGGWELRPPTNPKQYLRKPAREDLAWSRHVAGFAVDVLLIVKLLRKEDAGRALDIIASEACSRLASGDRPDPFNPRYPPTG